MQVPGLKLLNANVALLPCGGSVEGDRYHTEGDITLKLLHMYGIGYGFLTCQYYLDLPVAGTRYVARFQVTYLFQNVMVKHDIKLKIRNYFVLGQSEKNMSGVWKAWLLKFVYEFTNCDVAMEGIA
jgi:hypothetical protein